MNIKLDNEKLHGAVEIPASKSFLHRALIASALTKICSGKAGAWDELCAKYSDVNDDVTATMKSLKTITAKKMEIAQKNGGAGDGKAENRAGKDKGERYIDSRDVNMGMLPDTSVRCGESGTTLRLLMPLTAALGIDMAYMCGKRLYERPMTPLILQLESHGVSVIKAPMCVNSENASGMLCTVGRLKPGHFVLPGNVSSQFVSGLLFALPLLEETSTIKINGALQSAPYVRMTLAVLDLAGIHVKINEELTWFEVEGGQKYDYSYPEVEGDWSGAANFVVAGAIGKIYDTRGKYSNPLINSEMKTDENGSYIECGDIKLYNLSLDSVQGDKEIVRLVNGMSENLDRNIEINIDDCPDIAPILAVFAAVRRGETTFTGTVRLKMKESDRVESTCNLIRSLGGKIFAGENHFTVYGKGELTGGTVEVYNDHRIAMAAAIATRMCSEPVIIMNAECVSKSYNKFFEDYGSLQW